MKAETDSRPGFPARLATIITYLFHPLLIPTYGVTILYFSFSDLYFLGGDYRVLLLLIGITLITTCLLPAMSSYVLLRSGFIKSMEMIEPKERSFPYLITAIYYLFAYYLLKDFPVPARMLHVMRFFILGATAAILITATINFFWKISAHMVACGGLTGAVLGLAFTLPVPVYYVYGSIFLSGFIGFARLALKAHSPAQVYAGYLLGFLSTFLILYIR